MKKIYKYSIAIFFIAVFIGGSVLLSNKSEDKEKESVEVSKTYPKEISAYDAQGKEFKQTFKNKPERIVVIGQSSLELINYFNLNKDVLGVGYLDEINNGKEIYNIPIISTGFPARESIVALKPDLIYGMSSAFKDEYIGGVEYWNKQGINVATATDYNANLDVEAYYNDVRTLGSVFGIEDKSEAYINDTKNSANKYIEKAKGKDKENILVLSLGKKDSFEYYPRHSMVIDDVIEDLNGKYIELSKDNFIEVSSEAILKSNPDKIILVQFQGSKNKDALEKLKNDKALKNLAAIKNDRVEMVDYTSAVRGGLKVDKLYQEVYEFINKGATND